MSEEAYEQELQVAWAYRELKEENEKLKKQLDIALKTLEEILKISEEKSKLLSKMLRDVNASGETKVSD